MSNVVLVDLAKAYGIDELPVQHCGVDEGSQQALDFLFVAQRGVHLVGFLL